MKLRHFLDAAFTILVEEYQRMGMNLIEALEKLGSVGTESSEPTTTKVVAQNDASLRELENLMAGVG